MTRISTLISLPPKPNIVSLCELAIGAGVVGQSVAVHFQDFPAHQLCRLWQYCMNFAGPVEVRQIRNQSDVRKLPETCGNVKLALVHSEKLYSATAWAVQMASLADTEANSRPAIFCASSPGSDGGDPGAALTIRADSVEMSALARWFDIGQIPTVPNWQAIDDDISVAPAPVLASALSDVPCGDSGPRRLQERHLLRCLIEGAAVLRSLAQPAGQTEEVGEITLTVDDYEQVRRLLQSSSVAPADESFDPLTRDMVARANVFLQARYSDVGTPNNSFNFDGAQSPPSRGANRDLITRREIADLGNTRSRLVRQLIEFIRHCNNGYERFQRMGLARRPPPRVQWQTMETAEMLRCLRPWTAKQVRSHFDHLRRARLITAERKTANGPWRYALPEELQGRHSTFRRLPTAAELLARHSPQ